MERAQLRDRREILQRDLLIEVSLDVIGDLLLLTTGESVMHDRRDD